MPNHLPGLRRQVINQLLIAKQSIEIVRLLTSSAGNQYRQLSEDCELYVNDLQEQIAQLEAREKHIAIAQL